jgi:lysophospholipase L1-like esterase
MGNTTVRRRHAAFAAGVAALAMAAGVATAPAQAADKTKYIALGDSFAAGQGAGPYLDDCFRSDNAYSGLADDSKAIKLVVNAACSGKTTGDVVSDQLGQLNKSTELVTITAGGNNIGFGDIITACGVALAGATPGDACGTAITGATTKLQGGQLYSELLSMIRSVQAAAPNAKIVLTGYPYLLDPIEAGRTDAAALFIYQATQLSDLLNGNILAAAGTANAANKDDPEVQFVDVRRAFLGHGALSPTDPWINLIPSAPGEPVNPDNFHPNEDGYEAYFAVLSAAGAYSVS